MIEKKWEYLYDIFLSPRNPVPSKEGLREFREALRKGGEKK